MGQRSGASSRPEDNNGDNHDNNDNSVNNINEAVTIQFEGGPEKSLTFDQSAPNSSDLTLTWSAVEGGQYLIESSTTLRDDSWVREVTDAEPTEDKLNLTDTGALVTNIMWSSIPCPDRDLLQRNRISLRRKPFKRS